MVSGEIRDPRIEKCFLFKVWDSGPRFPDLNFRIWATLSDKKVIKKLYVFREKQLWRTKEKIQNWKSQKMQ